MKKLIDKLAELINVKTIVTFALIATFVVLAMRGDISADNVMIVVTTVVAFYFGTQHEKRSGGNGI